MWRRGFLSLGLIPNALKVGTPHNGARCEPVPLIALISVTNDVEIAEWLMNEVRSNGARRSYQNRLVRGMKEKFGEACTYKNHNGNPAIDRGILREFGKLKDEHVLWDRSDQSWRVVTPEQLKDINTRNEQRKVKAEETKQRRAEFAALQAERRAARE
jgi:hypothetical protein